MVPPTVKSAPLPAVSVRRLGPSTWLLDFGANGAGFASLGLAGDVPAGANVMKGKWAFAVKYNLDGSVNKFRARWVGCGYSEIYGRDYDETSIGTLNATTCRVLFAVAANKRRQVVTETISMQIKIAK